MNRVLQNPYALYVFCDGAMDYGSKNAGGVGLEIVFPEFVELESIKKSIGSYQGANIERIELEAILQGMQEVLDLFKKHKDKLMNIKTIIFMTDRFGLNDNDKTSPYRIKEWRRNKWENYEGKAIKNSDLLEKIDKTRKKIYDATFCMVEINYGRRKFNKTADKLAKAGKLGLIVKNNIALKGVKIGKRKFDDIEVDYDLLQEGEEYHVHVYKKEPVRDQWEISAEICDGRLIGKKLRIYSGSEVESCLHRRHEYKVIVEKVYMHHVAIFETIKEINGDNEHASQE